MVQQFANKHNLQLTTQQKKSKTVATNHVISQTPKAGMTLNHGDTLTVTIATPVTRLRRPTFRSTFRLTVTVVSGRTGSRSIFGMPTII
ncbi:MAG: PASTA domain-containing protein [Limosilactobacillus pontis]